MRTLTKLPWLPLLILLSVILIIGSQIYLDRKIALEYAVSLLTDYRLSINGDFRFRIKHNELVINLSELVLRNNDDEAPLFTARQLDLKARVKGLSADDIQVRELQLDGARAVIIDNQDGSYNWPISLTDDEPATIDWNSLLNKILISNSRLQLSGFSEQALQVDLASLALAHIGDQRLLDVEGSLNQYPLTASARFDNVSAYLLEREPLQLAASGSVDELDITATGTVGKHDHATELLLSVKGEELAHLTSLISTELADMDQLSGSVKLVKRRDDFQLQDLQLSLHSAAFTLNTRGHATLGDKGPKLELQLSLSCNDISQLAPRQQRLAQWQGYKLELATQLSYAPHHSQLVDFKLVTGNKQQRLDWSAKTLQIQHSNQRVSAVQAVQSELDYQLLSQQPNTKPLHYRGRLDVLNIATQADDDLNIQTRGVYKSLPVSAEGIWHADGNYQFDVSLDQARARLSGAWRNSLLTINGKLTTPSLKPLAKLFDKDEVLIDRGELDIGIRVDADTVELSRLDLTLQNTNSSIQVSGGISKLSNLQGLSFDVNLRSNQLQALNQWLTDSSSNVDYTLAALTSVESLASEGANNPMGSDSIGSAWLNPLMQQLDLQRWLDDYPMLNGDTKIAMTVTGSKDHAMLVDIRQLELQSSLANIQWHGVIKQRPGNFNVRGQLNAAVNKTSLEAIATDASISSIISLNNTGPLKLDKLHIIADQTQLTGELELSIDEQLQAVTGNIHFKQLDILPYLPVTSITEPDGAVQTSKKNTPDQSLFSTEAFPLNWLPDFAINLQLSADTLLTPWFTATAVKTSVTDNRQQFNLAPFELQIGDAPIHGHFQLAHSDPEPTASLFMRADNLDPDLISLLRNYHLFKKGRSSVLLELSGKGNNEKQLVAGLDGRISMVTRNAVLNGSDLNDLAPAVLKEINRKVNPFYDKNKVKDTQLECGIIHFDINDGLMEADKSIVLVTPEIVFGAHGAIDLNKDYLKMQIIPQTRKGLGLSFSGTFAKMAVIDGPILNPSINLNPTGIAVTGARDVTGTVLLGPLYWLYLGQAQKFLASGNACEKIISLAAPEFSE